MVPSPSVFRDAPQSSVAKQPTLCIYFFYYFWYFNNLFIAIYNEFDFLTAPSPSVFRDAPEPQKCILIFF